MRFRIVLLLIFLVGCQAGVSDRPVARPGEILTSILEQTDLTALPQSVSSQVLELNQGKNKRLAWNVCPGEYEIYMFPDTMNNTPRSSMSPILVDFWLEAENRYFRAKLLNQSVYRDELQVRRKGSMLIDMLAPYESRPVVFGWQQLTGTEDCHDADAQAFSNPSVLDDISSSDVRQFRNAADPARSVDYHIRLEWDNAVDLDLSSRFIDGPPRLGWDTPRWNRSGLEEDKNRVCEQAERNQQEDFYWVLPNLASRENPDGNRIYQTDLRFFVTFYDDCQLQASEPVRATYSLVIIETRQVFRPSVNEDGVPISVMETVEDEIARIAGCSIESDQQYSFSLVQISSEVPCEEAEVVDTD